MIMTNTIFSIYFILSLSLTQSINVTVTPEDGSIIALPTNSTVTDLSIALYISDTSLCNDDLNDDHSLIAGYNLYVYANGDRLTGNPTLIMDIKDICSSRVSFTLQNVHYGTQTLVFHILSPDRSINDVVFEGLSWYSVVPSTLREIIYMPPPKLLPSISTPFSSSIRPKVAVVGTGTLDGQKIIWLTQFRSLKKHIDFTYICYVCDKNEQHKWKFLHELTKLNIPFIQYPGFDISKALTLDSTFPLNVLKLLYIDTTSSTPSSTSKILNLEEKRFSTDFNKLFIEPLLNKDVLVFANSQSTNDLFLQEAAVIANTAIVVDLPNLHPTKALNRIDAIISPSHFVLMKQAKSFNTVKQFYPFNPRQNIVISPGIDIHLFHPATKQQTEKTEKLSKMMDTIRIGFIGRLSPEKSPGMFLRTIRVMELHRHEYLYTTKKFVVTIIGDGAIQEEMKIIAKRLGIESRIEYLGWLDRCINIGDNGDNSATQQESCKLSRTLKTLDVLINPSLRESETFCIANIEAMASGVPVVTLGSSGVGEYLNMRTNGTLGLVVDPSTPRILWPWRLALLTFSVIEQENEKNVLRETIITHARKHIVDYYSSENMVEQYYHLYLNLTIQKRRWIYRAVPISFNHVIKAIASSEVNKLSFDVKEAEADMKKLIHFSETNDNYANLMRAAVLGITRFPLIVHLPRSKWYTMQIKIKDLRNFRILHERSWWDRFDPCSSIKKASEIYNDEITREVGVSMEEEHYARLDTIRAMEKGTVSRVIVGVSTSMENALNFEQEGVTIIDGNHRSIHFVLDLDENEEVTLLLGLSKEYSRKWKGNFYCSRDKI